jgi:hypothetical protein
MFAKGLGYGGYYTLFGSGPSTPLDCVVDMNDIDIVCDVIRSFGMPMLEHKLTSLS